MIQFLKWAAAVIITVIGVNVAFSLISSRSDVGVMTGFLILVGIVTCYVPFIRRGIARLNASLLVIVALSAALVSSGCTRIDPGHVGIEVDYYGKNKGVEDIPQVTGMVWYNPVSTSVFQYPTYVQTAIWTRSKDEGSVKNEEISFNSREGMVITGDISLSYQLDAAKVPAFYVKFRSDNLDTFTHGFLRNIARDGFNEVGPHYSVEQIYGEKKEELLQKVREKINDQVKDIGVKIEQFGFIGAPRLPDPVVEALNNKITATQNAMRVQNELVQTKAEAQKVVAKAQGEADANKILTASISPELLQYRQMLILQEAVAKWDGHRPTVEGSRSGLLLSLGSSLVDGKAPK